MANDLTLRNARVLTATGLSDPTTVAVVDGVIVRDLRPGGGDRRRWVRPAARV